MSLTQAALYGDNTAPYMGATMFNSNAQTDTDWGAVLAGGIVGAAQGAISQMVGGAYASGQLVNQQQAYAAAQQQRTQQLIMLLVVGGLIYAVAH